MNATSIRLDYPRVESVPSKTWRDAIKSGKPVAYSHHISGQGLVTWEDGSINTVDVQFVVRGLTRTNSINGLLDRTSWKFQPARYDSLARALLRTEANAKGTMVEVFDLDSDGNILFDEDGLTDDQAKLGLPLLGFHVTGKSLILTNVSTSIKVVTKRDGGKKDILEVGSAKAETIDTPSVSIASVEEEEAPILGVIAAAARQGKSSPATIKLG